MIEIDIRKIIEIKGSQLSYYDENHKPAFVDLNACAEYHEKTVGRNPDFPCRSVGEREFPYYDFYSPDGIRLYLTVPKLNAFQRFLSRRLGWDFHSNEFKLWYSVQKSLNQNGWTTLDLS